MVEEVGTQGPEGVKLSYKNRINPFRVEIGDSMPEGHTMCANMCLMRHDPPMSALDHLLITNFIGPKPKQGSLKPWLEYLNNVV